MHDIRSIRDNPKAFDKALERRGIHTASEEILKIDQARRSAILSAETAQAEQNKSSKLIGVAKASGDEKEFEKIRKLVADKKAQVADMNAKAKALDQELNLALMSLPNILSDDVPDGMSEDQNVEICSWGQPREIVNPKEHFEIPAAKSGMDFETAAKISGSRFVVLQGAIARLHRALAQFMVDVHVNEHGLIETMTPVLVREEAMFGTNQLPKFSDDSYQTTNGWWLIPTSEVTLTNMCANEVTAEENLPLRMTAHTQCFRSEAGSAGKDTAGMLRQHQFEKIEMVSITPPDQSTYDHESMTKSAKAI